jgi:(p)ppGpp synthase/HD superfamily hydrolase
MATLERAITIAATAHSGQKEKNGQPYVLHPLRLMMKVEGEAAKMAAVLHDVVEDTGWTLEDLKGEGFSEEVIEAVDRLTRRKDEEDYPAFIERAAENPIARRVKLADLEDNMNVLRLGEITEKDLERVAKYHRAWVKLSQTD